MPLNSLSSNLVFPSNDGSSVILLKGLSMRVSEGNIDQGRLLNEQTSYYVKSGVISALLTT